MERSRQKNGFCVSNARIDKQIMSSSGMFELVRNSNGAGTPTSNGSNNSSSSSSGTSPLIRKAASSDSLTFTLKKSKSRVVKHKKKIRKKPKRGCRRPKRGQKEKAVSPGTQAPTMTTSQKCKSSSLDHIHSSPKSRRGNKRENPQKRQQPSSRTEASKRELRQIPRKTSPAESQKTENTSSSSSNYDRAMLVQLASGNKIDEGKERKGSQRIKMRQSNPRPDFYELSDNGEFDSDILTESRHYSTRRDLDLDDLDQRNQEITSKQNNGTIAKNKYQTGTSSRESISPRSATRSTTQAKRLRSRGLREDDADKKEKSPADTVAIDESTNKSVAGGGGGRGAAVRSTSKIVKRRPSFGPRQTPSPRTGRSKHLPRYSFPRQLSSSASGDNMDSTVDSEPSQSVAAAAAAAAGVTTNPSPTTTTPRSSTGSSSSTTRPKPTRSKTDTFMEQKTKSLRAELVQRSQSQISFTISNKSRIKNSYAKGRKYWIETRRNTSARVFRTPSTFMNHIMNGMRVTKHHYMQRSSVERWIYLSQDKKRICWKKRWGLGETSVELDKVIGFLVGPKSRRFQQMSTADTGFLGRYPPWLCCSIVLSYRTVDLTFPEGVLLDWVLTVQKLAENKLFVWLRSSLVRQIGWMKLRHAIKAKGMSQLVQQFKEATGNLFKEQTRLTRSVWSQLPKLPNASRSSMVSLVHELDDDKKSSMAPPPQGKESHSIGTNSPKNQTRRIVSMDKRRRRINRALSGVSSQLSFDPIQEEEESSSHNHRGTVA